MKIFLDSSKLEEVNKWLPVIDGVTTNPTILLKEGGDVYTLAHLLNPKPISIEVCGDFETDARKYAGEVPNAVIKIPLLKPNGGNNLELIKRLSKEGIPINCTALMSLSQVILATKCGARYVSLFAGRVDDEGGDYCKMIKDCIDFLDEELCIEKGEGTEFYTDIELIVGSIRTVGNVLDAVRAGAHIVTIPPTVLEKMLVHRFSLDTVRQFESDNEKSKSAVSGNLPHTLG